MENQYKIKYTPISLNDLKEIIDYIMLDSPTAANKMLDKIEEAISKLALFPNMCPYFEDSASEKKYRCLAIGNYNVFYVVLGDTVQIMRILHGKRQIEALLQ